MRIYVEGSIERNPCARSSGWLGIVLGSKLYVNYAKKPFDAAYSETLVELKSAIKQVDKKTTTTSPPRKRWFLSFFHATTDLDVVRGFLVAPAATEPSRPTSSASNEAAPHPPAHALVHLMSQFRMDSKAPEPIPVSLSALEKMSITTTQRLLAENGLEK